MASIGDIFYTFRGDGARLKADAKKEGEAAGATAGKGFTGRFKSALGGMKGGLLGGLGLGAGIGVIGAATAAVSKLTDVMGDAVNAAIEEEASISKLNAALEANVEGWDGNTDAIEETMAARMKLGFADDEQRESLALLVVATKDETKALALQRAAMDLARLKRISLKEASEALIKVENGQFRALKALGIKLREGATATEALAAVQEAAAGQAEAFAETSEGRLLVSQIKVGEAMEKLGARLLPLVVGAMEGASDGVEQLVLGFDALGDVLDIITKGELPKTEQEAIDLTDAILGLAEMIPGAGAHLATLGREHLADVREQMTTTERLMDHRSGEIQRDLGDTGGAFIDVGEDADKMAVRVDAATGKTINSVADLRDAVISYARDIVTKAYQIIEDKAELTAANVEAAELRKVIATGNATRDQKAQYRDLVQRQQELILDLAENGQENARVVKDAVATLVARLKTATGQERKAIQATIDALKRLQQQYRNTTAAAKRLRLSGGGYTGPKGGGYQIRHSGGPVSAGTPYVWRPNEELFVPNVNGTIYTDRQVESGKAGPIGGSTTYNIPLTVQGALPVRTIRDITTEMRRLGELGVLPSATASPQYRVRGTDR